MSRTSHTHNVRLAAAAAAVGEEEETAEPHPEAHCCILSRVKIGSQKKKKN